MGDLERTAARRGGVMRFVWWIVLVGSLALVAAGYLSGRSIGSVAASTSDAAHPFAPAPTEEKIVVPFARVAHGIHSLVAADDADPDAIAAVARPGDAPRDARERGRLAVIVTDAGRTPAVDEALASVAATLTLVVADDADADVVRALHDTGRGVLVALPASLAEPRAVANVREALARDSADGVFAGAHVPSVNDAPFAQALARAGSLLVDAMPEGDLDWYRLARTAHAKRLTRDLALDARDDDAYESYLLREGVALAHRTGRAVVVTHASPRVARILAALPTLADRADVDVVSAAALAYR